MIQRIQTIYLLVAAICSVVCLSLPLGRYVDDGLLTAKLYNLCIMQMGGAEHVFSFVAVPLFVILLLVVVISLYTIFMYRNRKLQMRLCSFSSLLVIGWYIVYAVLAKLWGGSIDVTSLSFAPSVGAALPAVALIFNLMARRAINADEQLVRAADRIR
ncbi:MAG: DUF4293 domain-containing protein [Prevotella sp.]|nr:DUF4293 domain-containing protein [Prevotella sp.]